MQMPLFEVESGWTPPKLNELPDWNQAKRVALDVETKDTQLKKLGPGVRRGGYIVGFSFALEDGPSYYIPIRHEAGGNVDEDHGLLYLHEQAKAFEGSIVGTHLQYDLDFLAQEDILFPKVDYFRDITIADPLINELHTRYNLNAIAKRHGFDGKDETLLNQAAANFGLDPKIDLWRLHSKYVGPYATQDAILPLLISRKQELLIEEQDLWNVYNLESKLLPALVRMKRRGIRIDQDKLSEIEKWSTKEETEALKLIKDKTGYDIGLNNVWKADALVPALKKIGVQIPLTPKTRKPSIDKELLDRIDHPVGKAMARARKVNKIRTTFAASIRRHMTKGRIHCNYNQIKNEKEDGTVGGAAYGRMSCDHPNMQQQPAKDPELGPLWKQIYLPEHDTLWVCSDWSQQEPRWVVHAAECFELYKAKKAGDKYRNDPNTDNHQMMADLANIPRKPAKEIFLGLIYGMGGPKLCHSLGLPTKWIEHWKSGDMIEVAGDEAQKILNKFDEEVPFVRKLAERAKKIATKQGYIKTHSGRRCRFPRALDGRYDWIHKALNRYVQGSSGDQAKQAIIDVDAAGFYLQLPVHDELDGSCETIQRAKDMSDIMIHCVQLTVPMKVDIEVGPNWGQAIPIKKWEEEHDC